MSGIYGCTVKTTSPESCLRPLFFWNRYYGREADGQWQEADSAMGCCQEHLSQEFSGSVPVLHREQTVAVIDALTVRQKWHEQIGEQLKNQ